MHCSQSLRLARRITRPLLDQILAKTETTTVCMQCGKSIRELSSTSGRHTRPWLFASKGRCIKKQPIKTSEAISRGLVCNNAPESQSPERAVSSQIMIPQQALHKNIPSNAGRGCANTGFLSACSNQFFGPSRPLYLGKLL